MDDVRELPRRPRREQPGEVERLAHLVRTDEAGHRLGGLGPGLGDAHPVAGVVRQHPVPAPVDVVQLGLVPHRLVAHGALHHGVLAAEVGAAPGLLPLRDDLVPQVRLLQQSVRDVDPEAVHATVQPEPQHPFEHVADLGVAPVEVRLRGVEEVEVPLAPSVGTVRHPGPRVAAEDRAPVVGRLVAVRTLAGTEQVARPLGRAGLAGQCCPEPGVLARGVVGHEVDDDPQPELVCGGDQRVGVGQGAEERVDVLVVGHVVAVVVLRRGVERRDPERVDPEVAEVGQPRRDPRQVADAVAVAVGEAADVDLVGHGVAPPCRRLGALDCPAIS